MFAFFALSLLVLVHESLQSPQDIEAFIKKRPTWSFELESVDKLIKRGAASLRRGDRTLTKADLEDRIRRNVGPETTHILKKIGDPKWPRNPPKSFDAREHWKECAGLFDQINDEGFCLTDGPAVAASVIADRYCIYTNGTVKEKRSAAVLSSCAEACTSQPMIHKSFQYAVNNGVPTGGHHNHQTGCVPWVQEPCFHNNLSYPDNGLFGRNSKKNVKKLELCSDYERFDLDCPIDCTNGKYDKTMREDSVYLGNWYYMSASEFVIRSDIYTYGPISTSIVLFEDFLKKPEGMYKHVKSSFLAWDKYLKLIGWGEENGNKYWLAVNTWDQWGEDKVFKIPRGENYVFVEFLMMAGVFGES